MYMTTLLFTECTVHWRVSSSTRLPQSADVGSELGWGLYAVWWSNFLAHE